MKAKTQTLLNASFDEIVFMNRDNQDFGDFWCLTDGHTVTICEQKNGEAATQKISIPVDTMKKIIGFLTRPRVLKERA